MKKLLAWLLVAGCCAGAAASAQTFEEGLAAYEAANAAQDPGHEGYARAFRIWKPLAAAGDARAQYHLGILHWYGMDGARFDQAAGFDLIRRSADEGYPQAQSLMGVLQERGEGVFTRGDPAAARAWYEKAAASGHCYSVRRLARAYANGELGLEPDPARSEHWRERESGCRRR